jgi:hypothetical protein
MVNFRRIGRTVRIIGPNLVYPHQKHDPAYS